MSSRHNRSQFESHDECLQAALSEGDPLAVRALIDGGADIHYKREHGYDALLDAVHGRDVARDPRLLELLRLLIAYAVELSGVSSYQESALRVLSMWARFDGVKLLLDAGADRRQLEWTPLMEAVALGCRDDVQSVLKSGAALEERDWWSRTAWLIALQTGDISKAELLREHGADLAVRGRCGRPPAFYAIGSRNPEMLRWLLCNGLDVNQTDDFGRTALIEAVEQNEPECVEFLLNAGADVDANAHGTALGHAGSRDIILGLLDAGADPAELPCEGQRIVLGLTTSTEDALGAVSPEEFHRAHTRRFGNTNPERINEHFWEAMVKCGASAYAARDHFEATDSLSEPVWCAQRFGQSLTLLPDGRAIQIGGEHEDFYDPDFCIYNDVFVFEKTGEFAIYGYPESVFPPTDFHTATLVGNFIYVIGRLGYQNARQCGNTPVYRLDSQTLRIERVETEGESPGWIHRHRSVYVQLHGIRVWGGTIQPEVGETSPQNQIASFVLDLHTCRWRRESMSSFGR